MFGNLICGYLRRKKTLAIISGARGKKFECVLPIGDHMLIFIPSVIQQQNITQNTDIKTNTTTDF